MPERTTDGPVRIGERLPDVLAGLSTDDGRRICTACLTLFRPTADGQRECRACIAKADG